MIYVFLAMIFYTAAIMLVTLAARAINTNLVTAIVNTISAIIPIVVIAPLFSKKLFENSNFGILMAIFGGIAIAFFAMALNKSFQINKVAIVSPIVFGGAIFLTAILSYIFLKEKISPIQLYGLIFVGIGLAFIIYAGLTGK